MRSCAVAAQPSTTALRVSSECDVDRSAPNARVVGDEAGQEIFGDARRLSILHQEAHDLIAGSFGPVPRSVERNERVALVFRRNYTALVERYAAKVVGRYC